MVMCSGFSRVHGLQKCVSVDRTMDTLAGMDTERARVKPLGMSGLRRGNARRA